MNGTDSRIEHVLQTAAQLAAEHEFRAAIEYLARENRQAGQAVFERQMLNYAIEGFAAASHGEISWGLEHDNRFADAQGLPEIEAANLDAQALRSGILGKGGLIVRGLMDAERVAATRTLIDQALKARKAISEGGDPDHYQRQFARPEMVSGGPVQFGTLGGNQYTNSGSVWAVDSPQAAFAMQEFYRSVGLPELLQAYFGEPASLSVRKWVLRCVPPNNGAESGWHQDGQFMGEDIRTVNLWVSLTDCGEGAEAPGIDILADNNREIYPTGTHGAPFDWTVGQGVVDELAEHCAVERPHFRPGDAVFFDHYNLHRTGFGTADVNHRYAVESWFFANSLAPAKQQPLLF
ncbi:hypothetical protein A3709_11185 [Halioglobus sp. HI00S01]|uniref:phytanoyl-CoA dioxygenase family protein n=1 Tax=Halioglobus sp. HI00S01 TaxID=1822214 RepID=UPI0007C344FE|nr:phytanoyl-CoA dioxygenase family protein [Halioglobus sp. HI00S01]KZX50312.1 hypothetical protein A3709_11185 [Halioglobus sp. HI00S01]